MTKYTYNHELKKVAKLSSYILFTYLILVYVPSETIKTENIIKIILLLGILFIIIDGYYPIIEYE